MMSREEIIDLLQGAKFELVGNYEMSRNLMFCNKDAVWTESNKSLNDIMVAIGAGYDYRIKPEPKYVPFTFEDAGLFWLKRIKRKAHKSYTATITAYDGEKIYFDDAGVSFEELLSEYEFVPDGSPAGRLVE